MAGTWRLQDSPIFWFAQGPVVSVTGATTYQYAMNYHMGPEFHHEDVVEKRIARGDNRKGPLPK